MLSTAQATPQSRDLADVIFVSNGKPNKLALSDLASSFQTKANGPLITCSIEEALLFDIEKLICIFLDDWDLPLLTTMNDTLLGQIKRLCQAQGVIWVTPKSTLTSNNPSTGMISGLARSLRSENSATKFVVLHYGDSGTNLINAVGQVYRKVFLSDTPSREFDFEYMEHAGILHVPRACEDDKMEEIIVKHGRPPTPELQPFIQPGRNLTLKHDAAGLLSGLYFEDQRITASSLDDQKIRIQVKAMGVNFKDVMVALGQVEGYVGQDCSGVVSEIGKGVTNVCVGDRVCASGRETFSTVLECDALNAIKIPDDMTFTDGASVLAIFCTAYYSLITVAHLQKGESVLIHAGAGGVGQAAIMIAQMIGAEIYATVGSDTKKEHLVTVYGLRGDRIFSSRNPEFGHYIREMTKQRGADVVLNSLGGELLRTGWESLANFGRFVEIGKSDIDRNSRLDMVTFSKSVTFASVDLEILREEKPALMQSVLTEVMNLFRCGKIKVVRPTQVSSIEDLESAFHGLQSGKTMGKVVIEPLPGQKVKVSLMGPRRSRKKLTLYQVMPTVSRHPLIRSDATYLITGGVGGLGRSMTKWLAQQGAKSIALLSRSGRASANAKVLTDEYSSTDVNIAVLQCDVGEKDQVRKVIEVCAQSMPPIRGVIHGAMVLHVRSCLLPELSLPADSLR